MFLAQDKKTSAKTKKRKLYPNLKNRNFYMEKLEIKNRVVQLKSVEDLAELLTDIKRDMMKIKRYPISEKQLRLFSDERISPKRFRTFHIRKKSGGWREIKAPTYQFSFILKALSIALDAVFEPDSAAMGFTTGKSVVSNADVHVGHNYVFNIDLKDFFPSIPQARVWGRLKVKPFNFSPEIAAVIAGLCCTYNEQQGKNVLPQGSPVSPLLTNAICNRLDYRMKGVAKRFGLHYSRYADDMTFSSMHNIYQEGSKFRKEILKIIKEEGFIINDKKTRLLKTGTRQEVTGLTVNDKANVSRKYVQELRWLIHNWEKFGYARAYALFYPRYKSEKGYIKKGEPVMENVIGGKLNYLKMVKGANNPAFLKLQARYDNLQQVIFEGTEEEKGKAKKFMFVQPYTMEEFKEYFHTDIQLEVSKRGKLIGKCNIFGMDKIFAVSRKTQGSLCPHLKELEAGSNVVNKKLDNCFVVLCRAKGKNYWMITNREPERSKVLSVQNVHIDPSGLLDIWEKEGIESAALELKLFIENAEEGDSIATWDPLTLDKTKLEVKERPITKSIKTEKGYKIEARELEPQVAETDIPYELEDNPFEGMPDSEYQWLLGLVDKLNEERNGSRNN